MITTIFISLGVILFYVLGIILPVSTALPSGILDSLTYVVSSINSFSFLIPVSSLFGALVLVVGYQGSMWIFRGLVWIWNKIPIIGK